MNDFKVGIHCDCTAGCSRCGQSHNVIDLNETKLVPASVPTATSVRVDIEMVIGSVELDDETGTTRANYFVKFSTTNGHSILYPWKGLKEMVLKWIEIENDPKIGTMK